MKAKKWPSQGLYLAGLSILCAGVAGATTTFNLSTGTATYTITSDTNGGLDADFTGTAVDVTSLPTGSFAHLSSVTDGIDTSTQWIGPNADQDSEASSGVNRVSGTTVYTVTFNLTGFNLATASLIIDMGADDYVSSVVLNPTSTDLSLFSASGGEMWATGDDVRVGPTTTGFVAGVNTIQFTVPNFSGDGAGSCCGPTGLIAAVDVTASSSVPEPGTLGATGLCLLGLAVMLSRRRHFTK
jgi:hypothetical protein